MLNLLLGLVGLLLLSTLFIIIPLRKRLGVALPLLMMVTLGAGSLYALVGDGLSVIAYRKKQQQLIEAKRVLKQLKGPEQVIARMKAQLKRDPNSAKGWYLLGRLYASQQQFDLARAAFGKAYQLQPNDVATAVHYLESLYITQNKHIDARQQQVIDGLFAMDKEQIDTLNFLAIDAYSHQQYLKAKALWQRVVVQLPAGSKERRTIIEAIAKSQQQDAH